MKLNMQISDSKVKGVLSNFSLKIAFCNIKILVVIFTIFQTNEVAIHSDMGT